MPSPIDRIQPSPLTVPQASPAEGPARAPGRTFADVLRGGAAPDPARTPSLPEGVRAMIEDISQGERMVDRVIAQAAGGRDFSAPELIGIQARVYRYTQELELVSKLVDKACAGVRQTLQTQV